MYDNVKEANHQLTTQRAVIDKMALILSCQTEFINLENILDMQGDTDKKFFLESFR